MDKYQKRLDRILPIPEIVIKPHWDEVTIVSEAEKYCKPFCCVVQRCLASKIRTEAHNVACEQAKNDLARCVTEVSNHIREIQTKKRLGSNK